MTLASTYILTTYYVAIILEDQRLVRKEFLANLSWKSIGELLVNFQTRDYRVFTKSYILSL